MTRPTSPRSTEDPLAGLVGTPFLPRGRTRAGLDCWGLQRLALQIAVGVEVPSYADRYTDTAEDDINARLIRELRDEDWHEVAAGQEQRLDAVLMRGAFRVPSHLGTVLRPGLMLHTYSAGAVRVDYYRRGLFKERIVGFYRHKLLA